MTEGTTEIAGMKPLVMKAVCIAMMLWASLAWAGWARAGSEIQGSVKNESRGLPAAGAEVVLLRLDTGMQEEARSTTDAQGKFRFVVEHPEKQYVVRVVHQQVNYDQRTGAEQSIEVRVFDAARQVRGIRGTIEIFRAGTKEKMLHVSDMYEIVNESNPPVTLVGERTFEAYLPADARMDSVLAAGPGKIGVMISARPVGGERGHYTIDFPLRPGANKFAFNYDVPYSGRVEFQTRRAYGVQQLAVMLPLGMKFESGSRVFELLAAGNPKYQVEATKELKAGEGPVFEVSGTGELPSLGGPGPQQASQFSRGGAFEREAVVTVAPVAGQSAENLQRGPRRLLLAGIGTLLGMLGLMIGWLARKAPRRGRVRRDLGAGPAGQPSSTLVDALREELRRLDRDKSRGLISFDEYVSTKQALEKSCQRAVGKAS